MIKIKNYKIDPDKIIMATTEELIGTKACKLLLYFTYKQIEDGTPYNIYYKDKEEMDKDYENISPSMPASKPNVTHYKKGEKAMAMQLIAIRYKDAKLREFIADKLEMAKERLKRGQMDTVSQVEENAYWQGYIKGVDSIEDYLEEDGE